MRRPLAAVAAVAALGALAPAAGGQSATTNTYALLSPTQPVPAPPPLGPGANAPQTQTAVELQLPGKLSIRELVVVGVGPDGDPVRVAATQRLHLKGTGDYAFTIPAPATSAGPAPESQSSPGLRDVGIVWQGFSNKQRILSAQVTLRTKEAAAALPLRVHIERQGASTVVSLENTTQRTLPVVTSHTTIAALLSVLGRLRRAAGPTQITGSSVYVPGTSGHGGTVTTAAPLRVTGTISQGGAQTNVATVLGRGQLERSYTLPGAGEPKLQLRVELLPPLAALPTPAQLRAAAQPLEALQEAIGAVAIAHAYRRFLAAPDPAAPSDATYVYRTAASAAASAARTQGGGSSDTLTIVLVLLGGVAALCGLAFAWARS